MNKQEKDDTINNELSIAEAEKAMLPDGSGPVTVTKLDNASVTSSSVSSLGGYAWYSASCTQGTMKVTVQYYRTSDSSYHDTLATRTIHAGQSFSKESCHEGGARLFRLKLSGLTGRGTGTIEGYD